MKVSEWPNGDYPVYINPTDEEMLELAKSNPDTLRICEGDDNDWAVASGHGNTHESVVHLTKQTLKVKYWSNVALIFFRIGEEWFWNPDGHWEGTTSEKLPVSAMRRFCNDALIKGIEAFLSL